MAFTNLVPKRAPARIGIIIPTFKESENIVPLTNAIFAQLPDVEVVVVDDSPDLSTVEAVGRLGSDQVKTIHRMTKGGRGSAVLEGMRELLQRGCEQIVEMDADFSHSPAELPGLLQIARRRNLDVLIASRYIPQGEIRNWPVSRRVLSRCANILARALLRVPVRDYTSGYRVYSRRAAENITETCGRIGQGFIALSEILVNSYYRGYSVSEVPSIFVNRVRGESSVNLHEVTSSLTGLAKIYRLTRQLRTP